MVNLNTLWRKALAELIGTFGLVTAGGAAIIASTQHNLPSIGVALAFGLVVALMVAATGHISGGHINPAVSIGLATTGHLPLRDLPVYLIAQLLGATLAAWMLLGFFGSALLATTVNFPVAPHISTLQVILIEAAMTAFLVFVISAVATDPRGIGRYVAPFAIGGAILLGALWGGPLTGASMNPARSFGPAVISGIASHHLDWGNLAIYIIGPIIGGIIGAVLYYLIRQPATVVSETGKEAFSEEVPAVAEVPTMPRRKATPVVYKQKDRTRRS